MVLLPKKANNLLLQWKGPYTVIKKVGILDHKLQVGNKHKTFHAKLLKKHVQRPKSKNDILIIAIVAVLDLEQNGEERHDEDPDELLTTPSKDAFETPDLVKLSDDLGFEEKKELSSLLHEFSDVFTDSPGLANLIEHEIRTTTYTPMRFNLYPLLFAMTKVFSEEINNMLKMKVI